MAAAPPHEPEQGSAPLLFFYTHLHDAIRAELGTLSQSVADLEGASSGGQGLEAQLAHLRDRYRFLEQVYKYHSSVEDEVRQQVGARPPARPFARACRPGSVLTPRCRVLVDFF
jgi:hypothetical protein